MDPRISDYIEKLIKEVGKCRREIEDKGKAKAKAISNYDMKLAIALATLRDAESYQLAGKTYKAPPVSIAEKIAKGIVSKEKDEMIIAESGYTATISNLEALKAQLNAFQSLYRHQE
jgi:hypothetical protein